MKLYKWHKGIGEGISSHAKAYSKWKYTEKAMALWAQRLKTTLDELAGAVAAFDSFVVVSGKE